MRRLGRTVGASAVVAAMLGSAIAIGALSQDKDTKLVPYPNPKTVTAKCGAKQHIGFGGFKTNTKFPLGGNVVAWVDAIGPSGSDTDKWQVKAHNDWSGDPAKVTSFAYCAKGKEPKVVKRTDDVPYDPDDETRVSASCPDRKFAIGGGWRTDADHTQSGEVAITSLARGSANEIEVYAVNTKPSQDPVNLTAIAICGKGPKPKQEDAHAEIDEGEQESATAKCRGSKEVVFGGFDGEWDNTEGVAALTYAMFRPKEDKLTVSAGQNVVAPTFNDIAELNVFAYCR